MHQIRYRIWQTFQAMTARWRPVEDELAASVLPTPLFALFLSMSRNDRQHHLRVYKSLIGQGHNHPALLQAALLHDVGKTRYRFNVLDRIWVAIIKTLFPQQFERWGSGEAKGWQRAIVISAQHPHWGAEMVASAGGDPLAVELIKHHQDSITADMTTELRELLPILKAADDAN